ncbi:hypothetical protein [Meiothermus sp.]|jgi:hypothetical protein|uniref:hypothetical protein n=1 Tax=Meiothermus sp. TaxID=1955249 RepID=UPI0021DCAC5F|nr:hypothetical protein [Meiothermus sp.]GIW23854.1 MAG: hypothetical protein KatS3mg069_0121 [Meiothermus sp.]
MQNPLPSKTNLQPALVHRAILVMDSRTVRTPLRRRAQPKSGWSQLYQAGPYHLDLSLKWEEAEACLVGQVISGESVDFGQAQAYLTQGSEQVHTPLDGSGRFSFRLESVDDCSLRVHIRDEMVCLEALKLS